MLCPRCQSENPPAATHCQQCRSELELDPLMQSLRHQQALIRRRSSTLMAKSIPTHLGKAIFATVFFFFFPPLGLWALFHALKVRQAIRNNDTKAALEHSRKAERLCWISFGAGAICWVLAFTLWLILMMALDPSVEEDGTAAVRRPSPMMAAAPARLKTAC